MTILDYRVCRMLHGMCGPCKVWPIIPTTGSRYLCGAKGKGLLISLHCCIVIPELCVRKSLFSSNSPCAQLDIIESGGKL